MRKVKKAKWLVVLMVVAMLVSLVPAVGGADHPGANYGFIPNSDESSVSKVLLNPDVGDPYEVARYSTVPDRDAVNLLDARPNRIDIDSDGNAWVLNTMSTTRSGFVWQDAQGSVVRISASPVEGEDPGSTTSNSSAMVEGDLRVSIIDIGAPGDAPRTIDVVEEGDDLFLWIGFYGGRYYEKFEYDADAGTLTAVAGTEIDVTPNTPYSTARDGDILWVSAIASSNPFTGVSGIFAIDMTDPGAGYYAGPFPFSPTTATNRPYDIKVDGDGNAWVSDATQPWTSTQERFFGVYDSDGIVKYVSIGTGSTAMRGFFIDEDGTIWATTANGRVLMGTYDEEDDDETAATNYGWTFVAVQTDLPQLTGIGPDDAGNLWLIMYGSDEIGKLDPTDPEGDLIYVDVGKGPYAYANFITPEEPKGCIDGYKALTDELTELLGDLGYEDPLAGWEIKLRDDPEGENIETTWTDENGYFEFCDLDPGTYYLFENVNDGTFQVEPDDPSYHVVEVVAGETTTVEVEGEEYAFLNDAKVVCETAWGLGRDGIATENNSVDGNPSNAWGWTNDISTVTDYVYLDLYTGAAQNDITKGTWVGTVKVEVVDETLTVTYQIDCELDCWISEAHLWVGDEELPRVGRWQNPSAAPGAFNYKEPVITNYGKTATFYNVEPGEWLAAHAVVCCFELNGNNGE